MKFYIIIGKKCLNLLYTIFKMQKTNEKKVLLLSRQSNNITLDYKLLKEEFENKGYKIKVITKKLEKGYANKINYIFHIINVTFNLASSKICIVDGYSIPVSVLNHKKELVVLQLWHALGAIKKFGYQVLDKPDGRDKKLSALMNMHKNYTYLSCSSEETKQFYSEAFNIEKSRIRKLGMPRVDYIKNLSENKAEEIYKEYPHLKNKKTIVYVPTFRKRKKINFKYIIKESEEKGYNLIIRKHPLDKSIIPSKNIINEQYNTYEVLSIADYIITDYSAIGIEATIFNKPLYFYLYDYDKYSNNLGVNINLFEEMKASTFTKINDLINAIEENNYNYKELNIFRDKYIETLNFNNTKKIVNTLIKESSNEKIKEKNN